MNNNRKGFLVVISGPSGGGKGTVVRSIREMMPDVALSVSATTRAPREGEADGREYYFTSQDAFEEMLAKGEILEHTSYCGNYYGTPKKEAERITASGRDMILEIEVDGAGQIKQMYPDAVSIMLIPPTISELEERLRGRGTEEEETIQKRLSRAAEEIQLAPQYDYVVINENGGIEECAAQICSIIRAERSRAGRMEKEIAGFVDTNCL